ncbi:MAG: hypothetical protein ACRDY5_09455, partial [Acidimicrobiales bacterium]
IEPIQPEDSGKNATLGRWADANGLTVSSKKVAAAGRSFENGDKCGDKAGKVKVRVDDDIITYDPRDILLMDGQRLTVAFVADGTDIPPLPPTALANLEKNQAQPAPTTPGSVVSPPITLDPTPAPPPPAEGSVPPTESSVPPASAAPATTSP